MTKNLAIVISGAVSLGSYEAGVMYEVLEAIARHNESEPDEQRKIKIDKITGASAGGMTASILAQNLLYDDGSLRDPYDNKLYKAWVEMVDIVPLLDNPKPEQRRSLLSVEVIESIAKKMIVDDATLKQTQGRQLLELAGACLAARRRWLSPLAGGGSDRLGNAERSGDLLGRVSPGIPVARNQPLRIQKQHARQQV